MVQDKEQATVMVVDDTPANLKLLEQMLQKRGHRVLAFPRGALVLGAAVRNPPDLFLLDITMPGMDGFELCRRLKEEETLRDIPVIFISALNETADKVKAFSMGGVDFVSKPFQHEEVDARVQTHLRLRKLQAELKTHNLHLEALVREKVREVSDSQMATIYALSQLAESRDDETGRHVESTQGYCEMLARRLLGKPRFSGTIAEAWVDAIHKASSLHDIGKVGIPDSILLKPGRLSPEEFEIMKTHVSIGADTLETAYRKYPRNTFLRMGMDIARSHHEKWDGSGYPGGLSGELIPLSARVMAVADVYDALRAKRSYKEPFSHEKSVQIIVEGSGKHFDPAVVEAFAELEGDFARVAGQPVSCSSKLVGKENDDGFVRDPYSGVILPARQPAVSLG
ncbi:MAG: HD domain-containing phosphohydrolase [Spirochaetota bacterium]